MPFHSDREILRVFNSLNAELNTICHLLSLLGAHHIPHVSRVRVNVAGKSSIALQTVLPFAIECMVSLP